MEKLNTCETSDEFMTGLEIIRGTRGSSNNGKGWWDVVHVFLVYC